ncbi:hypothetical protein E4634_00650 [Mangrovimicrobium sediminis]|uniref:Uncharacterized protein n=1 Tax=Mangrovimicrobium sediminis TaxID=2562682 RepID=A0A4Z0M8R6_9GAMM|nr:hypothetical protein [Haliea sp. SAOS-164]TGD76093.1 hypothetical protein E4634_00650 [Haliea sp. SAOS-164]
MDDKPRKRRRLGHYDYNRDENPLPDKERKWRDTQKQKLLKKFADEKKQRQQEFVELDPSRLGGQFTAVFAQLAGSENAPISNSTVTEIQDYSKKLGADIKWIQALLKELQREKDFLDDLEKWMLEGHKAAEYPGPDRLAAATEGPSVAAKPRQRRSEAAVASESAPSAEPAKEQSVEQQSVAQPSATQGGQGNAE